MPMPRRQLRGRLMASKRRFKFRPSLPQTRPERASNRRTADVAGKWQGAQPGAGPLFYLDCNSIMERLR